MANIKTNKTRHIILAGTFASLTGLIYAASSGFLSNNIIHLTVKDKGHSGSGGSQIDAQSAAVTMRSANPTNQSLIGTNLNGIADWSTEWPFVDVFKTSREWIAQREGASWGAGGTLKLTPEGWIAALEPGQYAETIMMIDSKQHPVGQYTLLYEGEGKIAFRYNSSKVVSSTPGRMVVDVTPGEGVFLQIREINPDNPIRNIRFVMPGFENTYRTQPFHPIFLERLSKFSTLRFMDWMATNNSDIANWFDRTTLESARQAGSKGVALEHMIQLANTLKIDPWFSIPAKASDDYVQQFAIMLRDRLDPSLKAHIEYSNEVWNGMFSQHQYAAEQGLARQLASDRFTATLRFYSERSVEIFKIFDQVFGSHRDQRVVRVLAGQAANPWTASQILGWKDAYKSADAYAIAPYFDGLDADKNGESDLNEVSKVDATLQMTSNQIIDSFLAEIPTEIKLMFENNYKVATKQFGLPLYAYEGGQHLTAHQFPEDKVAQVTTLFAEANRHPRMRDVYRKYLNQWQQSGGSVFNQFTSVYRPSKWGFWGALEYQNQNLNQAPKYQGLIDFMNANPR